MDTTILSSVSQIEKLKYVEDHRDFNVMGSANFEWTRLHPSHYKVQKVTFNCFNHTKPQNGLTKRKGPTWCKNVRKQIFFRFRYLIMAKKIYHALMVVYLILYLRHHQEHCTHGRCQGDFSIVWVGHRSPAQGVSPFIPSSCVCPWRHCTALLEGAKTCPCTPAPAMQVCLLQL